jgi:transcriptional regulator with XRE-family HTH domain
MELDNKLIGRNLAKFRKLRDIKASDLADRIGMKEGAYTKYERGESAITVELVQKVAAALDVNPISILTAAPDNFIESISNNTSSAVANTIDIAGDFNAENKQMTEGLLKQNETIIKLMEKVIELLGRK